MEIISLRLTPPEAQWLCGQQANNAQIELARRTVHARRQAIARHVPRYFFTGTVLLQRDIHPFDPQRIHMERQLADAERLTRALEERVTQEYGKGDDITINVDKGDLVTIQEAAESAHELAFSLINDFTGTMKVLEPYPQDDQAVSTECFDNEFQDIKITEAMLDRINALQSLQSETPRRYWYIQGL